MIKLRYDTKDFADIKLISENFNIFTGKSADTFLLHMSLTSRAVAGADVRSLRNRKGSASSKRILPLSQDDMQKSKVCDEMINFEKQDPIQEKDQQPYSYALPNSTVIHEF